MIEVMNQDDLPKMVIGIILEGRETEARIRTTTVIKTEPGIGGIETGTMKGEESRKKVRIGDMIMTEDPKTPTEGVMIGGTVKTTGEKAVLVRAEVGVGAGAGAGAGVKVGAPVNMVSII